MANLAILVCVFLICAFHCASTSDLPLAKRSSLLKFLLQRQSDSARSRVRRQASGSGSCDGRVHRLRGNAGAFTSPNYGWNNYDPNTDCKWRIVGPVGTIITLRFHPYFAIEAYEGCIYDRVDIYDGADDTAQHYGPYCGETVPADITSTGNQLSVSFNTDGADQFYGFNATYRVYRPSGGSGGSGGGGGSGGSGTNNGNGGNSGNGGTNNGNGGNGGTSGTNNGNGGTSGTGSGGGGQAYECSSNQILDAATGTIVSPTSSINTAEYPAHAQCSWRISAPSGYKITLSSSNFHLEGGAGCLYDYLAVNDGGSANSQIIGKFCGAEFPSSGIESTGSDLYITFSSDESIQHSGFSLSWNMVAVGPAAGTCGGTLSGTSGTLTSPTDGNQYPNDAQCEWVIEVPTGQMVELTMGHFSLEDSSNCMYDSVNIYNGRDKNSPLLETLCGTKSGLVLESSGRHLYVEFISDYSVPAAGFSFNYRAVSTGPKEPAGCGTQNRPALLTEAEGTIASPAADSSGKYPDNSFCQWRITVPSGKRAHLSFSSFSLEAADQCQYDHVEVYDGADTSATKFDRYCGADTPGDITASSNTLMVQFKSDTSVTAAGFTLAYSAKEAGGGSNGGNGGNGIDSNEPACGISDVRPKLARIVGGEQAISHSWPWQISLRYHGSHICGGSIISKNWVVTAAHCVVDDNNNANPAAVFSVRAGENDRKVWEGTEQDLNVQQVIVHESYGSDGMSHDIALLRLSTDINYSLPAKPVCLPVSDAPVDMTCITTGWGETQGTGDSSVLQQVRLLILPRATCRQPSWYGTSFTEAMMCAGYPEGGKDSCQGDSGGPLVCLIGGVYRLVGITSWGFGCAQARNPGIYTRTSRYYDWIDAKTGGAGQAPP